MTSTGVVSNGTEAGGGMIDAATAPNSQLMILKSLMTLLSRQVMADTLSPQAAKSLTATPNNYCKVLSLSHLLQFCLVSSILPQSTYFFLWYFLLRCRLYKYEFFKISYCMKNMKCDDIHC
jgi:hypothetical protein